MWKPMAPFSVTLSDLFKMNSRSFTNKKVHMFLLLNGVIFNDLD